MEVKKLNERQLAFCQEYVMNGFNGTAAYAKIYEAKDKKTASVSATNLLKDQRVKDEINGIEGDFRNIGLKNGVTKEKMVRVLAGMMDAEKVTVKKEKIGKEYVEKVERTPDWGVRFNGVMGFARLTGDLTEKKKIEITNPQGDEDSEVDLSKLSGKELIEARSKIIKNMSIN